MNKIVIKTAYNMKWYKDIIGRIYSGNTPGYAQVEDTPYYGYYSVQVVDNTLKDSKFTMPTLLRVVFSDYPNKLHSKEFEVPKDLIQNCMLVDGDADRREITRGVMYLNHTDYVLNKLNDVAKDFGFIKKEVIWSK